MEVLPAYSLNCLKCYWHLQMAVTEKCRSQGQVWKNSINPTLTVHRHAKMLVSKAEDALHAFRQDFVLGSKSCQVHPSLHQPAQVIEISKCVSV